jgi:hypothetical protein
MHTRNQTNRIAGLLCLTESRSVRHTPVRLLISLCEFAGNLGREPDGINFVTAKITSLTTSAGPSLNRNDLESLGFRSDWHRLLA